MVHDEVLDCQLFSALRSLGSEFFNDCCFKHILDGEARLHLIWLLLVGCQLVELEVFANGLIGVDNCAIIANNGDTLRECVEDLQPVLERLLVGLLAEKVLLLEQLDLVGNCRIHQHLEEASDHQQWD